MTRLRRLLAVTLALLSLPAGAMAQQRSSITGRVVESSTQRPISGATVRVQGTALGTQTNEEGRFTINGVAQGARTLEVSRVGYRPSTRAVTVGATPADVTLTLETDPLGLDAVVAIGYGEQNRRNVTGAVSSVRVEEVASLPTATIDNVLQGRLAGVQVTQNSGVPGSAITVRVRGSSSISAGNSPLYVVDGMPLVQGNFSQIDGTFGGQGIEALSDLNPNEIESIEVLKDASAAAIYGSRASNGVVLITTKRGRAGRAEINFGTYYGNQSNWRVPEFLNADEYIQVYNEGIFNGFGIEDYFGYDDDAVENVVEVESGTNTDWIRTVLRDAPISQQNGSIRGGTERVRYYVAGSALQQGGIVEGYAYDRLNGRMNLDYVPTSRLTLGTNVALTRSVSDRARGDNTIYGPFANAIANPPVERVFLDDGSYNLATTYVNPVALSRENEAEERTTRIIGNSFATFALSDGLTVRGSAGVDNYILRSRLYDSPIASPSSGSNGGGTAANTNVNKLTFEGTANFDRLFDDSHQVSGVVGSAYELNTQDGTSVSGQEFPGNTFRYLTSAAIITGGSQFVSRNTLLSFFGRLSYTYNDRYTATFNVRTDGSSKFGESNQWGTFPSASLLWRVAEEPFFQNQGVFSDLAIRASYGRTGNQFGIGDFASRALFGAGANYNDQAGIAPSQLGNPDLRWETTDQFNVGADLGFLDDRLAFTVDYYVKTTNDLLVSLPIPGTTGFTGIASNVGSLKNRGIELSARAQLVRGDRGGFNWTTDLNVSSNANEVTELLNDAPINAGFASRVEVGQPLGVFYGHVMEGIFQTGEPICKSQTGETAAQRNARCAAAGLAFQATGTSAGDIRFRDIDGNGVINSDDRTIIGNPWPEFEGGLTNSLSFRGFDMNVFFQFSQGNDIFNAQRSYTDAFGSGFDNNTKAALDRWTPENPSNTQPRAIYGDPNNNVRNSTRFIEDGSYVRLKNAVLGYTLPERTSTRLGFRSLRLYVQAQNLHTWTNYSGFDPEVNYAGDTSITRGTDFYTLPQSRTITTGFDIGF
jgi:TonB-dependent starch-binding outer membrane protein SusC